MESIVRMRIMATIRKKIDASSALTDKQLNMIKEAENTEYVFDEDNTILSKEELAQFRRVSESKMKKALDNPELFNEMKNRKEL